MSESIFDDGGPVHPGQWVDFQPSTGEQVVREQWTGISLRDWFAGQALAGLMAEPVDVACSYTQYAVAAYEISDAMIAARKGGFK